MQKRALCIGINNYPGTGSDLSGCVNDAQDWQAALASRGFTVEVLLDTNATKAAILTHWGRLVQEARYGDRLVLQYSGHGSWIPDVDGDEPDHRDEVLCPCDVFSGQTLSDDELFRQFDMRRRGVRIVFIADSCHSGTVSRFAPPFAGNEQSSRVRYLPPETFLPPKQLQDIGDREVRRAMSPPERHEALLFAGCRDTEYSYDAWFNNRPNGAFTYVALQALTGLASTAKYRDWFEAVRKALPTGTYPQTPQLFGTTTQQRWGVFV